jgi:hypothetical protein
VSENRAVSTFGDTDEPKTEILCEDRATAATEASTRQARESDPSEFEWIYLRNSEGSWVARRTEREPSESKGPRRSLRAKVLDEVVNQAIDTLFGR